MDSVAIFACAAIVCSACFYFGYALGYRAVRGLPAPGSQVLDKLTRRLNRVIVKPDEFGDAHTKDMKERETGRLSMRMRNV